MKGKQKILLLVCSVIAVVSVSCMAAYALLKTVTETKTNVFASDKSISIDLTEPQWERYGKEAAKVYVPGQTIDKDPTVSLNDESISAYVALKVQFFILILRRLILLVMILVVRQLNLMVLEC